MRIHNTSLKNTSSYGIVRISVAEMRREPSLQSEMVNQTVLGTVLPILDENQDFFLIQNWDGYQGWINRHAIIIVNKTEANDWQTAEQVIFLENYGLVFSQPGEKFDPITDLVAGVVLKKISVGPKFTEIELPDRQKGYVANPMIMEKQQHQKIQGTTEKIINQAKKFLGISYLWGGNSSKGFDCSGFVQTVFHLLNVDLPRDSHQMATVGKNVIIQKEYGNLNRGDLLFFGENVNHINHVAIYIGDQLYIHCRGKVRICSLNPEDPLFEKNLLLKVQRVNHS